MQGGVMTVSDMRKSSVDMVLGISAVDKALRANPEDQGNKRFEEAAARQLITADGVRIYLRDVSEKSSDEIDRLISDLRGLREQLISDGTRIEQQIVEYATLNQSVLKLAEVVSDSVAEVKKLQPQ